MTLEQEKESNGRTWKRRTFKQEKGNLVHAFKICILLFEDMDGNMYG